MSGSVEALLTAAVTEGFERGANVWLNHGERSRLKRVMGEFAAGELERLADELERWGDGSTSESGWYGAAGVLRARAAEWRKAAK